MCREVRWARVGTDHRGWRSADIWPAPSSIAGEVRGVREENRAIAKRISQRKLSASGEFILSTTWCLGAGLGKQARNGSEVSHLQVPPSQVFGQDLVLSVTMKGQGTARRDRQERGTAARPGRRPGKSRNEHLGSIKKNLIGIVSNKDQKRGVGLSEKRIYFPMWQKMSVFSKKKERKQKN